MENNSRFLQIKSIETGRGVNSSMRKSQINNNQIQFIISRITRPGLLSTFLLN